MNESDYGVEDAVAEACLERRIERLVEAIENWDIRFRDLSAIATIEIVDEAESICRAILEEL